MIKELYSKIKEKLETLEGNPVRHVDLWNRNVEFAEQDAPWERPAVFVEFPAFKWKCIDPGYEYQATPQVVLHIVTDWTGEATDALDLPVLIHGALCGLSGESFTGLDILESHSNHDHEDLVESLEVYSCDASRIF